MMRFNFIMSMHGHVLLDPSDYSARVHCVWNIIYVSNLFTLRPTCPLNYIVAPGRRWVMMIIHDNSLWRVFDCISWGRRRMGRRGDTSQILLDIIVPMWWWWRVVRHILNSWYILRVHLWRRWLRNHWHSSIHRRRLRHYISLRWWSRGWRATLILNT